MQKGKGRRRWARTGVVVAMIGVAACGSNPHGHARGQAAARPAPHPTLDWPPVPASMVRRALPAVVKVECDGDGRTRVLGSGFLTTGGVATASHVVDACDNGAPVALRLPALPGRVHAYASAVDHDDHRHGVALLHFGRIAAALGLAAETKPPRIGQEVVLLGFPGGDTTRPRALVATVVATGRRAVLTSAGGLPEPLAGAIAVYVSGLLRGESGGPAIDADGRVVGVVQGGNRTIAYITPATELPRR